MPPTEPMTVDSIAKRRHEEAVGLLDEQFNTAKGQIETDSGHMMTALSNQYDIQRRAMGDKFKREADPDKKRAIVAQMEQIKTTFTGRAQAIKDKAAPDLQRMTQAYQQEIAKLNRRFELQQTEVQAIRKLALAGEVAPAVAKQKALAAIGIDIPLSQFQKVGSVEQRKTVLEDDIRDITTFLGRFEADRVGFLRGAFTGAKRGQSRVTYTDPATGAERVLDPDVGEDAVLLNNRRKFTSALKKKEREFGRLLVGGNRQLQSALNKKNQRDAAGEMLNGTDNRSGGLEATFLRILGDNPRTKDTLPPAADIVKSLAAQGLSREQIREQMEALGYK